MSAARSLHDRYAAWLMLERGLSDNTRAAYAAMFLSQSGMGFMLVLGSPSV